MEILMGIKHGMKNSRFYVIWCNIKTRVNNKNAPQAKNYSIKGIKLCKSWDKFINFKNDMYEEYIKHSETYGEKNTTIDRINNNGNYTKKNCRWATFKKNQRNKSSNRNITYNGKTKCLSEWAEHFGLDRDLFKARIRYEIPFNEAIKNKSLVNRKCKPIDQYSLDGVFIKTWESLASISKHFKCSPNSIRNCLYGLSKKSFGYMWKYNKNCGIKRHIY